MSMGSKNRLGEHAMQWFPNDSREHQIARAVCRAGVLPRKEWFESWQVVKHVRRRKLPYDRVVDLCAGHGLVGWLFALLEKPSLGVMLVDERTPKNRNTIAGELRKDWPEANVCDVLASAADFPLRSSDLVVSVHACGALTDLVLSRALAVGAHVAVLPCCHQQSSPEAVATEGIVAPDLGIDIARAHRLLHAGYRVRTHLLDPEITPKNRLIIGGAPVAC
jgi:hypothetical protein